MLHAARDNPADVVVNIARGYTLRADEFAHVLQPEKDMRFPVRCCVSCHAFLRISDVRPQIVECYAEMILRSNVYNSRADGHGGTGGVYFFPSSTFALCKVCWLATNYVTLVWRVAYAHDRVLQQCDTN